MVACSNCGKASRVMKSLAGKTVLCPSCKGKIVVPGGKPAPKAPIPTAKPIAPTPKPASSGSVDIFGSVPSSSSSTSSNDIFGSVPSTPTYDVYGGSQQNNNALWNDLGDQAGGNSGWQPMGAAPANQYSAPSYGGGGYGGGGYSGGGGGYSSGSSGRNIAVYIIPGILISIWGFLVVISACVRLGGLAIFFANLPPGQAIRWEVVISFVIGAILGLILGAVQLFGGISLAMRNNLSMARTGAIVCTIPCFGLICFPFGIWAVVLLFTGSYKRDFGE
jgi:DNA-directed RNA polymerase subunit RPC12/RpoP